MKEIHDADEAFDVFGSGLLVFVEVEETGNDVWWTGDVVDE